MVGADWQVCVQSLAVGPRFQSSFIEQLFLFRRFTKKFQFLHNGKKSVSRTTGFRVDVVSMQSFKISALKCKVYWYLY